LESVAKKFSRVTDEILTVVEGAKLLKVAGKTVDTMAQQAELPCFKVRGQWRFRRGDIDGWIAARVTLPPAETKKRPQRTGGRR
jgi:excisionase family DNA binding protein